MGRFQGFGKNAFLLLALFRGARHDFGRNGQCQGMANEFAGLEILRFRRETAEIWPFSGHFYKSTLEGQNFFPRASRAKSFDVEVVPHEVNV